MNNPLKNFEVLVRRANQVTQERPRFVGGLHPFDERNVHPKIPAIVRDLFDDGHYAQATFEAYKFLDKEVQRHANSSESGFKLMMQAFSVDSPLIRLTNLSSTTEKDEQKGFQFVFSGSVLAIRNPRGHEFNVTDPIDRCLDHLCLASMLLRRLEEAGFT